MISSFPVVAGRSIFKGMEWPGLFTFLTGHDKPKKTRKTSHLILYR